MPPRLFYCDHYTIPLPAGHKFPSAKYRLLREMLEADGVYRLEPAQPASREAVEAAHDPVYVGGFLAGTLAPAIMRRVGFPWSPDLVQRTLASLGGTLGAADDALRTGFGGNLAGGTHHAFRAEGSGFCVFNDLAVAILGLRRAGRIRRAAVVDLDVHQGNGTAHIFEGDPTVFTLSLHQENNYPVPKARSSLDVGLADRTGDEAYAARLEQALAPVWSFAPELVLYQAGADPYRDDQLGGLSLSFAGLAARDRAVLEGCARRAIPVAATLGGGYARRLEDTLAIHAQTCRLVLARAGLGPAAAAGAGGRA